MKNTLKTLVIALSLSFTAPAHAGGGGIGGSTEVTQLMNNAELMSVVSNGAAQYGVELDQYITQYEQLMNMQQNLQGMANGALQMAAYATQVDKLTAAKTALSALSSSAERGATLLGADLQMMRQFNMTPGEYYGKVAAGAAADHEASKAHLNETIAAQADLQQKSEAVKALHLENLNCDGNVKCLQGIATQNAQLSEVMIEMSGDIKQLLALQLKRETERRDELAAQQASDYAAGRAAERDGIRAALQRSNPAK